MANEFLLPGIHTAGMYTAVHNFPLSTSYDRSMQRICCIPSAAAAVEPSTAVEEVIILFLMLVTHGIFGNQTRSTSSSCIPLRHSSNPTHSTRRVRMLNSRIPEFSEFRNSVNSGIPWNSYHTMHTNCQPIASREPDRDSIY